MMNKTITRLMTAAVVGLAMAGCSSDEPASTGERGEFFAPEGEVRSVNTMLAAQSARGAAADGTLYAAHFDGDELNSLGRRKLETILSGSSSAAAVRVYVNVADDEPVTAARREAVSRYLADAGVPDERVVVQGGDNPATRRLASIDSARLYKVEEGTMTGASGGSAAAATAPERPEPMVTKSRQ